MVVKYLKSSLRIISRQKSVSFIILAGLSVGLASSFLIMGFLRTELSYDRFHTNGDRIYRIIAHDTLHHTDVPWGPLVLGNMIREEIPGVKEVVPLYFTENFTYRPAGVQTGPAREFSGEARILCADSGFFRVFSFQVKAGRPQEVFAGPGKVAVSESQARKLFGEGNPIGQNLLVRSKGETHSLEIRAVFEDMPAGSSITADFLTGMDMAFLFMRNDLITNGQVTLDETFLKTSWYAAVCPLFLLLEEKTEPEQVERNLAELTGKRHPAGTTEYRLQNLYDIHLHSGHLFNLWIPAGNLRDLYLFSLIGFLLLLVATTNFMILTTASAMKRTRESAVRKVLGAGMGDLYIQHFTEAILFVLLAFPLALILVEINLPMINRLFETRIGIYHNSPGIILLFLLITLIIGLLSGWYTGAFISRTPPVQIIQGSPVSGRNRAIFRKSLVFFQILSFSGLLTGTGFIQRQIHYMLHRDPGYHHENILKVRIRDDAFQTHYPAFLEKIRGIQGVEAAAGTLWAPPTNSYFNTQISLPGNPEETMAIEMIYMDYSFMETMGFRLLQGRFFSDERGTDREAVIINETAAARMNLENPLSFTTDLGHIIGVVEDFHYHSLHNPFEPMAFVPDPEMTREVVVRYGQGFPSEMVRQGIMAAAFDIYPDADVSVTPLEDEFKRMYREEIRLKKVLHLFTVLIMVIASMGLFGLSMFLTELRTREIGIRKVFGAGMGRVMKEVSAEFLKMTLVANLLAWPVAWHLVRGWLRQFPFRIGFEWWIFLTAGILSLAVVWLALGYQTWQAARTNPAETLKYE